ncbi:hypothetical protein [Sanguibacter antarcticus]|uniref:hypothetical protein n=1 Tax=Sanguibacter antarcticus TaxID=372484 RepID=UPI001FEA46A3|nr:hypothetical protein [Sanguibacter antarcticus]
MHRLLAEQEQHRAADVAATRSGTAPEAAPGSTGPAGAAWSTGPATSAPASFAVARSAGSVRAVVGAAAGTAARSAAWPAPGPAALSAALSAPGSLVGPWVAGAVPVVVARACRQVAEVVHAVVVVSAPAVAVVPAGTAPAAASLVVGAAGWFRVPGV